MANAQDIIKWLRGWVDGEVTNPSYISAHLGTLAANCIERLRAERDEAAHALKAVLAGRPVRNADEIIERSALSDKEQ